MRILFSASPEIIPVADEADRAFIYESMAVSVSSSLTAVIRTWVTSDTRSEKAYLGAVILSIPAWISADGTVVVDVKATRICNVS